MQRLIWSLKKQNDRRSDQSIAIIWWQTQLSLKGFSTWGWSQMKCWTSECLAEVPDPAQTEPYMDREEGSLSGSSGKQNELEHDTKALAFIWPAAHRSPKLQSNSQGVSTQTDNGGISSRKLSKMTTVSYSLEKEGSCQHTIVCLHMVCMWGLNARRKVNTISSKQAALCSTNRQNFSQRHILCFIKLSSSL